MPAEVSVDVKLDTAANLTLDCKFPVIVILGHTLINFIFSNVSPTPSLLYNVFTLVLYIILCSHIHKTLLSGQILYNKFYKVKVKLSLCF
jgi:hypothetical protein